MLSLLAYEPIKRLSDFPNALPSVPPDTMASGFDARRCRINARKEKARLLCRASYIFSFAAGAVIKSRANNRSGGVAGTGAHGNQLVPVDQVLACGMCFVQSEPRFSKNSCAQRTSSYVIFGLSDKRCLSRFVHSPKFFGLQRSLRGLVPTIATPRGFPQELQVTRTTSTPGSCLNSSIPSSRKGREQNLHDFC